MKTTHVEAEPVATGEVVEQVVTDESAGNPPTRRRVGLWTTVGAVGLLGGAVAADPEGALNVVQQIGDYVKAGGHWVISQMFSPLFENPSVGPAPQEGGPVM